MSGTTDPNAVAPAAPMAPIAVPSQLSAPTSQDSLTGDNWARNLMLLGSQMASANNARFGKGFLANPGMSGITVGLGNTVGQISALDSQAATTQHTLAEAETARMQNAFRAYTLQHPEVLSGQDDNVQPNDLTLTGNKSGSKAASIPAPNSDLTTGAGVIPENLRGDMVTKAVNSQNLPTQMIPLAMGLFNQESGFDSTRNNTESGAIGIGQILPSTARKPGFGMEGVDPDTLKDPQQNMNFAVKYLYQRGKAMGITDKDYADNPGQVMHVLLGYGGHTDGNGNVKDQDSAQRYISGIVGHGLSATGHQSYSPTASLHELMQQLLSTKMAARPGAAPNSPVATGAAPAVAISSTAPPQAAADSIIAQRAARQQATSGQPSVAGGSGTTPPPAPQTAAQTPPPGFDAHGNPLPAGAWDSSPVTGARSVQVAGPGAPTDTTTPRGPVPQPGSIMAQRQIQAPAPVEVSAKPAPADPPTSIQPASSPTWMRADGSPVPTNGTPSPAHAAPGQATQPPQQSEAEVNALTDTLTKQATQAMNSASTLHRRAQAVVMLNPTLAAELDQRATAFQAQGQAAYEKAMTLKLDYVKQRATTGTDIDETVNGIPGQRNSVTGKFTPLASGSGRLTPDASGNLWLSPPDGKTPYIVAPANTGGMAAKSAAGAQGTETGKTAGEMPEKLASIYQKSTSDIANVDIGLAALNRAQKGGLPAGYFAPWYAAGAAMAKNLGVAIPGVDPNAVPDAQLAQKTLGIVSGAILQSTVGGDKGQITDAKIQHFIHTQPGLETDPQAIQKILTWARTQYVYDNEMSKDGLSHVDPNTGMIPLGWKSGYLVKSGGGPIYNPLTQETKQPDGQAPSREPPPEEAPSPSPKSYEAAVETLRANPSAAAAFDKRYGAGAAAGVLGGHH